MNRKQRVIWSDNGTKVDISAEVNDFRRGTTTLALVAAQDKIYIGAELPFLQKHFEIGVANDVPSVISIKYWDGAFWRSTVDVKDESSVGGVTLAQSGILSWTLDPNISNWHCQRDSNTISELSGTRLFDLYWIELTFTGNLKATTTVKFIGEKFNDDDDLDDLYPDLANAGLKTAFEAGKTDWKAQEFAAANEIVQMLRRDGIVIRAEQIGDWTLFNRAAIHKTAEIIYRGLGNAWADRRKSAHEEFISAMDIKFPEVDRDGDGRISAEEKTSKVQWGTR